MDDEIRPAVEAWFQLNEQYLETEMERLRLLLRRRILWLQTLWDDDPLDGYQGMVVSDMRAERALSQGERADRRRFYERDDEAAAVGERIEKINEALTRQKQQMKEGGVTPAIDMLVQLFGLSRFEREVVLLCLAPEMDAGFQKLYAYVQDDPARKYATPHLALTLFAGQDDSGGAASISISEARNSFRPQAPLRRYRLIDMAGSSSDVVAAARSLRLEERVTAYLQGMNQMDAAVAGMLHDSPRLPVVAEHRDLVEQIAPVVQASFDEGMRPAVNVIGPAGSEKEALAGEICNRLNMDLYRLPLEKLPSTPGDRLDEIRRLEREAVLLQLAFYVAPDGSDDLSSNTMEDVIERLDALIFVDSDHPLEVRRQLFTIDLSRPDARGQEQLWNRMLDEVDHRLNGSIETLVQQFSFGPRRVGEAIAEARRRAKMRDRDGTILRPDDIWQACRRRSTSDMQGLARKIDPCYGWDDIVLPDDTFDQLREIAGQVEQRRRVYDEWGFRGRMSRGLGISALFSGPSGTGKTMAAEVLAGDLELDLYRIDLASMVSKYIGETEKNLKKLFDGAERSGAILFFDEADALFGKRTEVSDSHDRYANIEVDYLLQRMEEYRGLAILATNRKSDMDEAFLRRLRFIVDFPRPNAPLRRRIWEHVFPVDAPVGRLDYAFLSQLEITGANIHNIALNAAFLAAEEESAVGMDHVMHAARREYEKINKLVTPSEFGSYYDEK